MDWEGGLQLNISNHLKIYWGKTVEVILTSSGSGGEYVAQVIIEAGCEGNVYSAAAV